MIRLRDFLAELPDERFDMTDYLVWDDDGPNRWLIPISKATNICGTAACIAGWAQVLFDPDYEQDDELARKALGLTEDQADALFLPPCRESLTRAHAIRVLDRYLATGEIDWKAASLPSPEAGAASGRGA